MINNVFSKKINSIEIANSQGKSVGNLPVDSIKIDNKYQRLLNRGSASSINKIVKNFNSNLIGTLIVNERKDGYYVIDGQHRLEALKILKKERVLCYILKDLSPEQEAECFIHYNQSRKNLSPYDIFKAELFSNDEKAVKINEIITSLGLKISPASAKRTICAIGAMKDMFQYLGEKDFKSVFELLVNTWDGDSKSFNVHILMGMKTFYKKYKSKIDSIYFVKKLSKTNPNLILANGNYYSKTTSSPHGYEKAILECYNENLRNKIEFQDI